MVPINSFTINQPKKKIVSAPEVDIKKTMDANMYLYCNNCCKKSG